MNADDWIARHDLEDSFACVQLADCVFDFRRQRTTQDVWYIVSGPLGTLALPLATRAILDRILAARTPADRRPSRPKGVRMKLDADFAIDIRVRGPEILGRYLFADGSPLGGFGGGLPSRRTLPLHLRVMDWLRGRRGSARTEYAVRRERP